MRVGLIGCGPWGRLILRDLLALGADVFVWSWSEESRMTAGLHGAKAVFENITDLPTVDGFVVATSASTHFEMIEAIAHRNVPIFVEKPLCIEVESAQRLAQLLPHQLFVMDKWRYHNGIRALQKTLASGRIGDLVGLKTVRVGNSVANHSDVDAAWTLAPHDLSISLQITGEIGQLLSAEGHVDSTGMVRFATATLLLSTDAWHQLEIGDQVPLTRREVVLFGTNGTAILGDGYSNQIEVRTSNGIESERFEPNMPLLDELEVFLTHLAGGPKPVSSVLEGTAAVKTISDIRKHLASKIEVRQSHID